MKAPTYDWRCHSCEAANVAGAFRCASCGFPAFAPGRKIVAAVHEREATRVPAAVEHRQRVSDETNWLIFFPEGIFALFVVLASPFWFLSLLSRASYAKAGLLAFFVASGLGLGWWAWRSQSKWVLYTGMVAVLAGAACAI
jgi:hypothetical protein